MDKYLTIEKLNHSAIITLSHPPANTFTVESLREFAEAVKRLDDDESIRSLVITGSGDKYFSCGADLKLFVSGNQAEIEKIFDAFNQAFGAIRSFSGVTVAAINGYALGSGLECALLCDYMVAERGAKLGLPETKIGLIPVAGGTKTLADKVGRAWAKRMILGGEVIDAQKALEIGLVEELVDTGFAKIVAVSLANKVTQQAPLSVSIARKLIEEGSNVPLEQHLKDERLALLGLASSDELREGLAAFFAKRAPTWGEEDL